MVVALFLTPHSFIGEDVDEISCHGSIYIQQKLLEVLFESGARLIRQGEFTQLAFFLKEIDELHDQLLYFTAMVELELNFA